MPMNRDFTCNAVFKAVRGHSESISHLETMYMLHTMVLHVQALRTLKVIRTPPNKMRGRIMFTYKVLNTIMTRYSWMMSLMMHFKKAAALFILKTRENHRIPISTMDTIIGDVSSLYKLALSAIKKQVISILQLNGEGVESAVADLFDTSHFANVFLGLETHYQQLQYIKRNFNFVVLLDFVFIPMMIMFYIV